MPGFRWKLADEEAGEQPALFPDDELVDRHIGTGEFRGMEFLHVNARRIINEVPAASRVPFRYTLNAYRGCSHACTYCAAPDTPVLMADGRLRPISGLRPGDEVIGTKRVGRYRRYVATPVLDHWETVRPAVRTTLDDGTELITSGDHRFLTERGWKHVAGGACGPHSRASLTANNSLLGIGLFPEAPKHTVDYQRGYLCGVIRGDGHLGHYGYLPDGRPSGRHVFRLALAEPEPLARARSYLEQFAIGTESSAAVQRIESLIAWPVSPSDEWLRGFMAGVYDAEGHLGGVIRISNKDPILLDWMVRGLRQLGLAAVREPARANGVVAVRLLGGLPAIVRFILAVDPATTRKRAMAGMAMKGSGARRVVSVEELQVAVPMFDITTGTGDFIANGVVSHNCFARPTHEYLGLGIGEDFDRKVVVKVNAVERLRAELASPRWSGDHIAMGTNTDPYQRCEGKYHLTQGIVTVLAEAGNPFSVLTKSTLILRDLDRLRSAAGQTSVRANFSIGTLDEAVWRATEPGTPHPRRRVEAVARLNDAGVPCGVLIAPVLPGLSDSPEQLEAVIDACVQAGAVSVSAIALHLRAGVRDHFMAWLAGHRPDLVEEYERRYRRAYLPAAEQQQLADLVAELVRRARGRYEAANSPRRYRPPDPEPRPVPTPRPAARAAPAVDQLELSL